MMQNPIATALGFNTDQTHEFSPIITMQTPEQIFDDSEEKLESSQRGYTYAIDLMIRTIPQREKRVVDFSVAGDHYLNDVVDSEHDRKFAELVAGKDLIEDLTENQFKLRSEPASGETAVSVKVAPTETGGREQAISVARERADAAAQPATAIILSAVNEQFTLAA
jgi:hypothetical protein